ncbi:PKD domain-containing protein [Candidatus Pacearchaeota archaeon]|nr:PKD domain-containing protein [Candidatus Pacearchaeota archaeon]
MIFLFGNMAIILAGVTLGNISYSIDKTYARYVPLKGWINVSLDNMPLNTEILLSNYTITLSDFLKNNSLICSESTKCSCFPADCSTHYTYSQSFSENSLNLPLLKSSTIGIKLIGNISNIIELSFNVSTDASNSCISPLIIDVLDDNSLEWISKEVTSETCFSPDSYGCFEFEKIEGNINVGTNPLCNEIPLVKSSGHFIGANLYGNGDAIFHMTFEAGSLQESCSFTIKESGEKGCSVSIDNNMINATVCIYADNSNTNSYTIDYENNASCGFTEENGNIFKHDFDIFARPLKYSAIGNFNFNQNILEGDLLSFINHYLDEKYNNNCNPECIIPIKFYSGTPQTLSISGLRLRYNSEGLEKNPIKEFYVLNVSPALVSSDFITLDVSKTPYRTPSKIGNEKLTIVIGDKTIKENISVSDTPLISGLYPTEVPLLVQTTFVILIEGVKVNESYTLTWDFGDNNSVLTSSENKMKYTYTKLGDYTVKVTLSSPSGNSSKTFMVKVIAPYDALNKTLSEYKSNLLKLEAGINGLPAWMQGYALEKSKIEDLKSSVNRIENKYKQTFRNEEESLSKLMSELVSLKVPQDMRKVYTINPFPFIQKSDLNALDFERLGAGEVENDKESYYEYIQQWLNENLDISFSSKTYALNYDDKDETFFSEVSLTFTPKKEIEKFYIVVKGNPSDIIFDESYDIDDLSQGYGITLSSFDTSQQISFIHPDKISLDNLPIYVSPLFDELEITTVTSACNNNNRCEEGENYKNCRADCKPWGRTIIYLFLLLLFGFACYIFLQEWYKRRYESYLFKDKNQLFNLVAFMSNAKGLNMSREEIFKRLKQHSWTNEQMTYAWNKLQGWRTGMWEIPIFKIFEKRKVEKELEKRKEITNLSRNNLLRR